MLFGNCCRLSSGERQRKSEAYRPRGEVLEVKALMANLLLGAGTPFDLASQQTTPPNGPQTLGGQLPFIADSSGTAQTQGNQTTDPGLGVLETGNVQAQGVGYSTAAVGDMNFDGSNDFVIGAPTVTRTGTVISPGTGNTDTAYLVFANRSVNLPTVQSWLASTPEQRVGLLAANLGGNLQFNPFTNRGQPYSYTFDGVSFITSLSPNSGLGTFVAQAGPNAFVIGAPNYGGPGVGRLYYITATSNFNLLSLRVGPIDLDRPQNYPGLTIVTFEDSSASANGLGTSFADVPDLFADGIDNLVIGEPLASVNNSLTSKTGNGGVFVFQATSLPLTAGANNVVDVQLQSQFTLSVGANSGDAAGFSVANAGDVNVATLGAFPVNDLLIGAPGFNNNAGAAYLVYGGTTLANGLLNGNVDLSRLQITPIPTGNNADATPPQGAVFVGSGTDRAGATVSGAGNFNSAVDTLNDFMIGSPGANGQTGRVNLFYGINTGAINSTGQYTAGLIANATNPIALNNPGAALNLTGVSPLNAQFLGSTSGERAGFSLSYYATGANATAQSVVLIGSPGWNGGQGAANELLGPSTGTFQGSITLENSSFMRWYTLTFPTTFQSSDAIGFGNSVSAFPTGNGDFIAGAPGYTGTLATGSPPIPLVGAAAMVLASLQPQGTLPTLSGTGGGGGGGGGGGSTGGVFAAAPLPPGLFTPPDFVPPLGTNFVPSVTSLSTFNYAPIPLKVALQQYLPPNGFAQRFYAYHHPGKGLNPMLVGRGQLRSTHTYAPNGVSTLGTKVFTRGRFHPGKTYQWTHTAHHNTARVVPSSLSRQRYTSQSNPLGKV